MKGKVLHQCLWSSVSPSASSATTYPAVKSEIAPSTAAIMASGLLTATSMCQRSTHAATLIRSPAGRGES